MTNRRAEPGRPHTNAGGRHRPAVRPRPDTTPPGPAASYEHAEPDGLAWVRDLLRTAQETLGSFYLADSLGEPQHVLNQLVEQVWDLLTDNLNPDQRITALLVLLGPAAQAECDRILAALNNPAGQL